jgi:hypothetical protein
MGKGWWMGLVVMMSVIWGWSGVQAQPEQVLQDACPYREGDYYQADVFPRYELRNQRLLLVSWQTGAIVNEVQTSLATPRFVVMNWSPDCRYLAAALGEGLEAETAVWDVTSATRVGTFAGAGLEWSPDSQQALVMDAEGVALWSPGAGDLNALEIGPADYFLSQWETDTLWLIPYSAYYSAAGVTVFDRSSAEAVGYFDNPAGESRQIGFMLVDDGAKVLVYTVRAQDANSAGITIWDREDESSRLLATGSEEATVEARALFETMDYQAALTLLTSVASRVLP